VQERQRANENIASVKMSSRGWEWRWEGGGGGGGAESGTKKEKKKRRRKGKELISRLASKLRLTVIHGIEHLGGGPKLRVVLF